jgi:hypothetical protein
LKKRSKKKSRSAFDAIDAGLRLQGSGSFPREASIPESTTRIEHHWCPAVDPYDAAGRLKAYLPNLLLWTGTAHRFVIEDKPMNDPVPLKYIEAETARALLRFVEETQAESHGHDWGIHESGEYTP